MEKIGQFKIKENGFNEIQRKVLIKVMLSCLIVVIGVGVIYYLNDGLQFLNIYFIGFMTVVVVFGLYNSVNKQKIIFESFKLTFDGNKVIREQSNTSIIEILYSDITEVIKNSNDSFIIKGKSALDFIIIPSQIEKYIEVENLLADIKPISTINKSFLQRFNGIVPVLTIGLMVAFYVSDDKIVICICGLILLIGLIYSLFEIQKSKNIDVKTKKGMWFILLVIASIIGVMYFKLTNL